MNAKLDPEGIRGKRYKVTFTMISGRVYQLTQVTDRGISVIKESMSKRQTYLEIADTTIRVPEIEHMKIEEDKTVGEVTKDW